MHRPPMRFLTSREIIINTSLWFELGITLNRTIFSTHRTIPNCHHCLLILCVSIQRWSSLSGMRYDFPMKMPGRDPIRINLRMLRILIQSFCATSSVDKNFSVIINPHKHFNQKNQYDRRCYCNEKNQHSK